jgi:N-acetylneuraminate lyase
MSIQHLEGLIAAPFTPMYKDHSINTKIIPQYYEFLKANGITGAFICGSTGEGVSMTMKEKMSVAEAWATATKADPDFKVMMFLGGTCIADCKELALHARQVGLDAISITAPFYFKPPNIEALAAICMDVASVVPDMPLYYYHIPVLTGVGFLMIDLLKELDGKLPNFAGVKYTHEDFMDFLSCMRFKNGRYDMLWGRDENMLPALAIGAKGAVGSTFNYAAPLYHGITDAFQKGDLQKAQSMQQTSIDMIRLLGKYGGIATGKAYMKLLGLDCGEFRSPVKNMAAKAFELFRKDVELISFGNFSSKLSVAVNSEKIK